MTAADEATLATRRHAWLTLSLVANLGPVLLRRAATQTFGILGVPKLSHAAWCEVAGIGSARAAQIIHDLPRAQREADDIAARCEALGHACLTLDDDAYPILLRDLPGIPPVLYLRGHLEPRDIQSIAIVGSRKCSLYGREQATRLAAQLAGEGFTIVSGGARGIDAAGHEGALRTPGGRTLAVMGCGLDICYPPENADLFSRITGPRGALISPYPPGTPPIAHNFLNRNAVISGLSRAVIVVEADLKSGAMRTAQYALDDHNRPVLAVPGHVNNPTASGPHALIRDGATLITSLADVLQAIAAEPLPDAALTPAKYLPPHPPAPVSPTPIPPTKRAPPTPTQRAARQPATPPPAPNPIPPSLFSSHQSTILTALRASPETSVDALVESTGLPPHTLLSELTLLTLKGAVKRVDAQTFTATR